ncbi:MAG: hypothetical protein JNL42_22070 [Anaerolineae bacterium]|nr:hypothetical protein [Anaerolineae bacterium]
MKTVRESIGWLLPACLIALIALAARLPYLALDGSPSDFGTINQWGEALHQHHFAFYAVSGADHPPLLPIFAGLTQPWSDHPALAQVGLTDLVRLKLPSLAADLLLVVVMAYWLRNAGRVRLLVLLLLALHPGLIADSALWTQSDSVFTTFMVLAILLLRGGKPNAAWAIYALALLTKFQAVALLPLMMIMTYRRTSLKALLRAAAVGGGVGLAVMLPFMIGSGVGAALTPYLGSVNSFPYTTGNAYNIWVAFEPGYWTRSLGPIGPPDTGPSLIPFLTQRQLGFLLLGAYTLLVCLSMWRRSHEGREFVWGAALYFGFFMLPTQIHERYLYPGVVMAIIAIAQDRRMIVVALMSLLTFTFNIIASLAVPYIWIGSPLRWYISGFPPYVALINLLLLFDIGVMTAFRVEPRPLRLAQHAALVALLAVVLSGRITAVELPPDTRLLQDIHVGDGAELVGYRFVQEGERMMVTLYWKAVRPIFTNYSAVIEMRLNGKIIASDSGSTEEMRPGSWRWSRGRVYPVTYWLDLAGLPLPDALLARFYVAGTEHALPIRRDGDLVPEGRIQLSKLG